MCGEVGEDSLLTLRGAVSIIALTKVHHASKVYQKYESWAKATGG